MLYTTVSNVSINSFSLVRFLDGNLYYQLWFPYFYGHKWYMVKCIVLSTERLSGNGLLCGEPNAGVLGMSKPWVSKLKRDATRMADLVSIKITTRKT